MCIRRTYYRDYGMTKDEVTELRKYCRETEDISLITQSAKETYPAIASLLVKSVRENKSYETLDGLYQVPIEKESFYGYQRKMIFTLKVLLENRGKAER